MSSQSMGRQLNAPESDTNARARSRTAGSSTYLSDGSMHVTLVMLSARTEEFKSTRLAL